MRTRRENHPTVDVEQGLPLDDCVVWNSSSSATEPEEEAKKDFAESLEKQRKALEELLKKMLKDDA
jgi:hypothetical protein